MAVQQRVRRFANYGATPADIALPIVIAETAFPLWLLIKGINAAQ